MKKEIWMLFYHLSHLLSNVVIYGSGADEK